jgi:hypothetical protein
MKPTQCLKDFWQALIMKLSTGFLKSKSFPNPSPPAGGRKELSPNSPPNPSLLKRKKSAEMTLVHAGAAKNIRSVIIQNYQFRKATPIQDRKDRKDSKFKKCQEVEEMPLSGVATVIVTYEKDEN